ncbi:MAG: helix-turn-helix domain-containing protein [Janthinobacterium lividum]
MTKATRKEQESERDVARKLAINAHVGSRLRLLRNNVGMSSKDLAVFLGVTYQQVLSYETGNNKVSAGNLYLLAEALNVPISVFFDGMPDCLVMSDAEANTNAAHKNEALNIFSAVDIKAVEIEVRSLTDMFYLIDKPAVRRGIIEFLKTVGKEF